MEELKGMGIDKNILLKHIKLQELVWYGGDFRDDQSKPRYEPTKEDFLLTIPFVERYLYSHGYRQPTKNVFQERLKYVFNAQLKQEDKKTYEFIAGSKDYDFANAYYAISSKGFITYNWLLRDLIAVESDKVRLKPEVLKLILVLNNFVFYDDRAAFKFLELSKHKGDDDFGDFYDGKMILQELFEVYKYFGSQQLNQWYFQKTKGRRFAFDKYIFERNSNNQLIAHQSLMETIERNTNEKGTYITQLGLYVYKVLQDEDEMNAYHYNLEDKAQMFCYFANLEYKMRKKYYPGSFNYIGDFGRTSYTYIIMTNCEAVYEEAKKHNYFGISKPAMMEEMEQEGLELNPPGGDPE
ncbi:hypothetical protein SAMN02745202_00583 [Segatella oulorum]|uniref:Uncharacterized protein n=1 Tax=Segatella oulorum TaxID=28136 RepID=A0A1T4M0N7_9BACT|nr:hypothetical protein [Segatella oulorum]SJZ60471.1 hypothetical protein SAMN02745202_00583 [Segatella oulorum]